MAFIYFMLAIIATSLGALAGLGGGVIIKPALDMLGQYGIATVSVLSSATVFSMAVIATIKQAKTGFVFEKRMFGLAIGAIIGGIIGKQLFSIFVGNIDDNIVKGVQAVILALLLILVLFKDKFHQLEIKNIYITFLLGVLLGTIAAFLGIGGGPINVAILCIVLGLRTKDAAVISIFIILFSQLSKLILIAVGPEIIAYDLSMLWFMIPGGILGGIIGSKFNRLFKNNNIDIIFKFMLVIIIGMNVYNAVMAFINVV